jgi:hypothetical protein
MSRSDVQLTIRDKQGFELVEIEGALRSVLWRLGQTGMLEVFFPFTDAKVTRANLLPGNRVLAQFSSALPTWGGVLDFPLGLTGEGVSISAYEGERLLEWRVSGKVESYSATVPGAIAEGLLETANATRDTGVAARNVYAGGDAQTRWYRYENLLGGIRTLAIESGLEYAVVPVLSNGRVTFALDWHQELGDDKRDDVALVEGKNVGKATMDEQGPVYNQVLLVNDWDEVPVIVEDGASRVDYDLRQLAKVYVDVDDTDTLQAIAEALLAEWSQPHVRGRLEGVSDLAPGRYRDYHVGDIVTLRARQNAGRDWVFDAPVRILSRQWNPGQGCSLEVEQWRD